MNTRAGKRWRCTKSIKAARRSVAERDEYGRQVTAVNSATHRARSLYVAASQEHHAR